MILATRPEPITVTDSKSVFSFRTTGGENWPVWDRFIAIHDSLAVQIGNVCGTCQFFFQRVSADNAYVDPPAEIAKVLNARTARLDDKIINTVTKCLPNGRYRIALSSSVPVLVKPGDANDYFVHEQPALWNGPYLSDGFHDPKTTYYRLGLPKINNATLIFEFMVPMVPSAGLQTDRVRQYLDRESDLGTVLAVSTLDVKQPADFAGSESPAIGAHACLTHYILDGHHKAFAAASGRRQVEILSFLSLDNSVASGQEIEDFLRALKAR